LGVGAVNGPGLAGGPEPKQGHRSIRGVGMVRELNLKRRGVLKLRHRGVWREFNSLERVGLLKWRERGAHAE